MTVASPTIKTSETKASSNRSVHAVMVVRKIYVRRISTDEENNNGRDKRTRIRDSSGKASRMFNARTKKTIKQTKTKEWNLARLPKNRSRCHQKWCHRKSQTTCNIEISLSPDEQATHQNKKKRADVFEVALEKGVIACENVVMPGAPITGGLAISEKGC